MSAPSVNAVHHRDGATPQFTCAEVLAEILQDVESGKYPLNSLQPLRDLTARIRTHRNAPPVKLGRPRKQPPLYIAPERKFCFHCATDLPLEAFGTDRKSPDGKRPCCRGCDSAEATARYHRRRARLAAVKAKGSAA